MKSATSVSGIRLDPNCAGASMNGTRSKSEVPRRIEMYNVTYASEFFQE